MELPLREALRMATNDHAHLVSIDVRAVKVPAGMELYRNQPMMEKYPGVDCSGDIRVGGPPAKKQKFNKKTRPQIDFD